MLAAVVLALSVGADAGAETGHEKRCVALAFPVHLPGSAAGERAHVAAHYCFGLGARSHTVQVLVHGGTYNSSYWDWPQFNGRYSYVDRAVAAGYATLAIDRIGDGASTRPASSVDTFDMQVDTLHQVLSAVREWGFGLGREKVELIGHSYGSLYAEGDLALHPGDADALILTGSGHTTTSVINAISRADTYPANNLPRFRALGLDDGYLTSTPGLASRAALVYDPAKADPRVIQFDADTMDTLDLTEARTRPIDQGALSIRIQVPVLLIDGNTDNHYCGLDVDDCSSLSAFHASEAPYFSPAARLTTELVDSGHSIQLSYANAHADAEMLRWSRNVLGKGDNGE